DQAESLCDAYLRAHPHNYRIWTLEGITFSMEGDTAKALHAFHRALLLSPRYPVALRGAAQLLFAAGSPDAIPILKTILNSDGTDQTAREMLALIQAKTGDCTAATANFQRLGAAIQTHLTSLEKYGFCLAQLKRYQEAIPVFVELTKLQPGLSYLRYDLAVVQVLDSRDREAVRTLQPLLDSQHTDAGTLTLASNAYEAIGDTPRAVSLLRRAIVMDPARGENYVRFADLCLIHKSYQAGIEMINAGLERVPNDPSLYISRAMLYSQLAEYGKAEADLQAAEELDPKHGIGPYGLALVQLQASHPNEALATVKAELKSRPHEPLLQYLLARLLMDQGASPGSSAFTKAMSAASLAVQLQPDFLPARDLLARIYIRSGETKLAIRQCRAALKINPSDRTALYHLLVASRADHDEPAVQRLANQLSRIDRLTREKNLHRAHYRLKLTESER
ncbi:MAG: tetratricopeptide repeat protein, partial [Terriglobia bacterium]